MLTVIFSWCIEYTPLPPIAYMKPGPRETHIRREVRVIEQHCHIEREKNNQKPV
jgi:hypothetical protein